MTNLQSAFLSRRSLADLGRVSSWLDEIKSLAGPNPGSLVDLHRRVGGAMRTLAKVVPPEELVRDVLTVTGGKLTTFRLMALDALKELRAHWPELPTAINVPPPRTNSSIVSSIPLCSRLP